MGHKIGSLLAKRYIAVALSALTAGILFVGRYLVVGWHQLKAGAPFDFFSFHHPDPLTNLAPMFRQVMDGMMYVSDGRVLEHVANPSAWSFVSPLVGYPLLAVFQDVSLQFLFGTILSAALVFIISYAIAKHLTRSHWWSLIYSFIFVNATLVVLFIIPIDIEGIKTLARSFSWLGSPPGEILMSRYVSFSVFPSWPVFVFSVYALLKLVEKPSSQKWMVTTAATIALLTHMYVTDALYIVASAGLMTVWYFLQTETQRAKTLLKTGLLTVVLSIPYIINYLAIQALPHAQELVERLGAEFTHQFRINAWPQYLVMVILAYGVWQWGKQQDRKSDATVIGSLALAGIGILNMQVVLGFNPHPQVWPVHQFYLGYAVALLVIVYGIVHAFKNNKIRKAVSVLLIVASVVLLSRAVYTEFISGVPLKEGSIMPQNIRTSLDWIDENLPENSVVGSPSATTNSLIPVYTSAYSIQPLAVTSVAPLTEVIDRWLTINSLYGIEEETLVTSLKKDHEFADAYARNSENGTAIFLFDTYFWEKGLGAFDHGRDLDIPDEAVNNILTAYETLPSSEILLEKYALDYLYVGPYEWRLGITDIDALPFTQQVYNNDGVAIYKINREELTF